MRVPISSQCNPRLSNPATRITPKITETMLPYDVQWYLEEHINKRDYLRLALQVGTLYGRFALSTMLDKHGGYSRGKFRRNSEKKLKGRTGGEQNRAGHGHKAVKHPEILG